MTEIELDAELKRAIGRGVSHFEDVDVHERTFDQLASDILHFLKPAITAYLQAAPSAEGPVDEDAPLEFHMSLDELRREVRQEWDDKFAIIRAIRDLPEIPSVRVMLLLSRAAKWPDDNSIGKRIQREQRGSVPYKSECEGGMGLYHRIREGLLASPSPPPTCKESLQVPSEEEIAAVLDPEIWAMEMPVPTRADTTAFYLRRQTSCAKARAVLALMRGKGE